jgi:hypothetical protein
VFYCGGENTPDFNNRTIQIYVKAKKWVLPFCLLESSESGWFSIFKDSSYEDWNTTWRVWFIFTYRKQDLQ